MLCKDEQRLEGRSILPHEARVVDIQRDLAMEASSKAPLALVRPALLTMCRHTHAHICTHTLSLFCCPSCCLVCPLSFALIDVHRLRCQSKRRWSCLDRSCRHTGRRQSSAAGTCTHLRFSHDHKQRSALFVLRFTATEHTRMITLTLHCFNTQPASASNQTKPQGPTKQNQTDSRSNGLPQLK